MASILIVDDEPHIRTHLARHVRSLGHIWGGGMVRVARVGSHDFYVFGPRHAPVTARVAATPPVDESPVRLTSGPSAKSGPATSS